MGIHTCLQCGITFDEQCHLQQHLPLCATNTQKFKVRRVIKNHEIIPFRTFSAMPVPPISHTASTSKCTSSKITCHQQTSTMSVSSHKIHTLTELTIINCNKKLWIALCYEVGLKELLSRMKSAKMLRMFIVAEIYGYWLCEGNVEFDCNIQQNHKSWTFFNVGDS